MRINVAVPEDRVSKPILDATLEGVTRLNEAMIRAGDVPLFRDAVNRVRWKPEPPGDEHFDHAQKVLGRGWGDCDDLAPWHAASLRVTGEDRGAQAVVRRSGAHKWHAIVDRSNGSVDDPSREAGMGKKKSIHGATVRPLPQSSVVGAYDVLRPKLALRPMRDRDGLIEAWEARADLPWHSVPGNSPAEVAMASLHRSPVASQAIVGACVGAIELGEHSPYISDDMMQRAYAMTDAVEGCEYDELAGIYGEEIAGDTMESIDGFFKSLGRGFKAIGKGIVKVATSKFGRGLISMIPGVGPVASTALDMASPALNKLIKGKARKVKVKMPSSRILQAAAPRLLMPSGGGGGGQVVRPSPALCAQILQNHFAGKSGNAVVGHSRRSSRGRM